MSNLLNDIGRLGEKCNVLLLTDDGEVLCMRVSDSSSPLNNRSHYWQELIGLLQRPESAQFNFALGRCYLLRTPLGYLIACAGDAEAIDAAKEIGGELQMRMADPVSRIKLLLGLLRSEEVHYHPQIVEELSCLADSEVAHHLVTLLGNYAKVPVNVRDRLLLATCRILGDCRSRLALGPLQAFVEMYNTDAAAKNPEVEQAARVSIQQLQLRGGAVEEDSDTSGAGKQATGSNSVPDPPGERRPARRPSLQKSAGRATSPRPHESTSGGRIQPGSKEEAHWRKLLLQGKKEEASGFIVEPSRGPPGPRSLPRRKNCGID